MGDKEIIIDGKKEKVNILFECNHVDKVQAYRMIENGIEINSENVPICNFKIKIVSNTKSPYGFYTIFQKDPKKDEWEYMGIGNSGASSLITALLKAHKMGLKRISDLEERVIKHSAVVEEYCSRLADKEQECEQIKEKYEALKLENQEGYEIVDELKQECEELKEEIKTYKRILNNPEHKVALTDVRTGEREVWRKLGSKADRYRKALDEIDKVINNIFDRCLGHKTDGCTPVHNVCEELIKILDIINKAKGEGNE